MAGGASAEFTAVIVVKISEDVIGQQCQNQHHRQHIFGYVRKTKTAND